MQEEKLKKHFSHVYKKWGDTHKIEKVKGVTVDLRTLADDESVVYGDGNTFHFKLTRLTKQDNNIMEKATLNDKEVDKWINDYIDGLPKNWRTDIDMYLAMKNAFIVALGDKDKYINTNIMKKEVCEVCGSDDIIEAPSMGTNCNCCNPL